MVLAKYGDNTEIDENAGGDTVIRNTATGTEILLADFVDIVGGVGSSSNRVSGTSYFDGLDANSVTTVSGTIDGGKEMWGVPSTSNSGPTTFNSWREVSADRPSIVIVNFYAETDGTSDGEVRIDVDESGGTNSDYYVFGSRAGTNLGDGGGAYNSGMVVLPAGGQYQIDNTVDPKSNNIINEVREWIL